MFLNARVYTDFLHLMGHKYYCRRCKAFFYTDNANVNERHTCGEVAQLDWAYKREAPGIESQIIKEEHPN